MDLRIVAEQTLAIVERGSYRAPSGREVSIAGAVAHAVRGTVLYPHDRWDEVAPRPAPEHSQDPGSPNPGPPRLRIEVTPESTAQAARRLYEAERISRVAALNFASAVSPGGGFIHGAKAQEEDLARCSALYPCLLSQPRYYSDNRGFKSHLYTDHMLYSPDVPFFRDDELGFLEEPFLASIVTAPAPFLGRLRQVEPAAVPRVPQVIEARAEKVLRLAAHRGHRTLVLGAWGCGAFVNEPTLVADIFARHLASPAYRAAFERVVFAIYDRSETGGTLRAFRERFAQEAS